MSSKCTAAKAYDILGIYDFPDNFDALNGLHSYLYTNSDMVVEALASQKYDLARDIVTAIETVDKDGSYDDCAFYVSRDGIRILRTAEELIDALGDENGKTASTLLAKNGINVLNGDIVAVGFDPETGESRSLTDGELSRVEGYFTVISEPGSGEKAVDAIRHGMEPCGYDISVETHDMASGKDALLADAPQRDAPAKDTQNIG